MYTDKTKKRIIKVEKIINKCEKFKLYQPLGKKGLRRSISHFIIYNTKLRCHRNKSDGK